jgi:hypothetical protein
MSLTNYGETAALNHLLNDGTKYVQLHTGDPGEDATANVATEDTRQALVAAAASGNEWSNSAQLSWTVVAATENVSHFSIWDAASAGNAIAYGTLEDAVETGDPVALVAGGTLVIEPGDLVVTAD